MKKLLQILYCIVAIPFLITHELCHVIGYTLIGIKVTRIEIEFIRISLYHRFVRSYRKTVFISLIPYLQPIVLIFLIIFGGEIFTYIGGLALLEIIIAKLLKSKSTLEPSEVDWFNVTDHSRRLKEMDEDLRKLCEDCE